MMKNKKIKHYKLSYLINPYPAKLMYLNFHPFKVVSRYRDPQFLVGENYLYLFDLLHIF